MRALLIWRFAIPVLFVCCVVADAQAQLFGPRALGQPLSGRRNTSVPLPEPGGEAGALTGNERFLRENRPRNAFVGADRQSQAGFVGSEQAVGVGRVQAATETLQPPPDPTAQINRPLPPLAEGQMYYPRLVIAFDQTAGSGRSPQQRLETRDVKLSERLSRTAGQSIQVSRVDGVTVLRGEVASRTLAEKLALIASFEPHVDRLQNQLRVATGGG